MQHLIKQQFIKPGEERRGIFFLVVVTLLRDHGNLSKVARETEVPYQFINRMARGETVMHDVTLMESLYKYLTGEAL